MSRIVIQVIFLIILYFVSLDCEVYQDRPKIKTSNGDLILEPAFDKNIYLRPNGPKSTIFVGETNILNSKTENSATWIQPTANNDISAILNGPNGVLKRLERLENRDNSQRNNSLFNISTLWRKLHTLNRKVINLQDQINSRVRDECQTHPCQHGGTCLNLANGYYCMCPSNWEGRDCDIDVNECRNFAGTDLGCQNGATCINRPGSYECLCRSGWYGLHCTRRSKDCSGGDFEMCGYGSCVQVSSGSGIKCICNQGWTTNGTGETCLTDVNECESNNGCSINPKVDCINLPGSFRCGECPSGYEGDGHRCSDIDECTTITPNGGCSPMVTCHNTIGSRFCGPCPPGYQGDGITCTWRGSCNMNHGGCHPSAQCLESLGQGTQCICPEGMEGDGIGIIGCFVSSGFMNYTIGCEMNPCGIHGQCHSVRNGYTCICYKGYGGAHCDTAVDFCASNPCENGGTCRPDPTSTNGFRCECTAQFSGSLCQVRSKTCGGLLDNEEGSIVFPLTNTTYNHNAQCAWVIRTIPDKVINVTFTRFNVEVSPECSYDFLQIHDGGKSSSQLIGRYCGNDFPKGGNIVSSHNNLYFWFHSDKTVAKSGFALHWTSVEPICGGEVDATTHGHISSPGSPGPYPPNRDCYWHLSTTLGKRISLHFFALDIEAHSNCSFDYLAIYDGRYESDPLLNKYCNSTQPAPVQSASSHVMIHFHSDAYGSGSGFQIAYAATDGYPGCGGYYTADKGEIASPSFNGKYLGDMLCEYKIRTDPGTKIQLDFNSFKLERSLRCKYDYLKIYDGPSADSRLVGKFCGTSSPKIYISSSNMLYIKFKSDHTLSTTGFRITYKAVCENTIAGDSGVITSPGYPFEYPKDKVCTYVIRTNPGKAIQLTFQEFDLEDNRYYNCRFDSVEIRDGPDVNSTLLGRYCGGSEHIPPVQTSSHNYMFIKFNSDLSLTGRGFYANFTTIDTKCGAIHREMTGLINFPSEGTNYKNNQSCSWILIALEGMHIKLTWNRFELEDMPQCASDYLELVEIDDNNQNNYLGKFCGNQQPPAITTSTNRLQIKFVSDNSIRATGFSVSYTFLDEKSHCDGMYIKSHGLINSPGWPKSYEPNRDCTWVISVPVGQQVKLNVSHFNLEKPIRGKCDLGDYLEIRNGGTSNSPLIGQFCGSFNSRLFTSLANVMYIHFHSDFYLTGTGFQIEWDGTITGCGGTLTSSSGSISSPNYPNNYYDNAECFYRIVTSAGSRIQISFVEIDLEQTHKCRDDYIEIHDGRNANAPSIGKYCNMSPNRIHIETTSNFAFITFRSDLYRSAKGFMLTYNTICKNNLTGRYGVIESPDYPSLYPLNLDCLWNIRVPKGNTINITFTHFDVYKSYRYYRSWMHRYHTGIYVDDDCSQDYLQTKESTDPNYSTKNCGTSLPPMIHTKSNSINIKFSTGAYIPKTGFRLEWISDGCGGHIQKQSGTLSLDKSISSGGELECEWLIETQMGMSITISFTNVFMTVKENCTLDAIEVYNGQNTQTPLIAKFCHQELVSLQSQSNYMLVRFVKQSTLKDIHFTAQFKSSIAKCGGQIQARTGLIQSPNYPKNYDNNIDCLWYITVPLNHRIELNFLDLDLYSYNEEDNGNESCADNIQIYEGIESLNKNYTYRICPTTDDGSKPITQLVTKSNNIVVQFKTNGFGTAKGFKANFSATCGATITAEYDGFISNQQFISHLNSSCVWTILAATPDQKISLTIRHMSVPKNNDVVTNRNCPSSFLRVFDGNDNSAPLIDEYCGRKAPQMIVSHGSALTIELGSYTDKIMGFFVAHYSPLSNACGGTMSAEFGAIASPNYPGPYPNNADCQWIINTSPGNTAHLSIERFDLEYSDGCNEDYLELRENNGAGKLLGVYCGNEIPTNSTTASKIYIKFHSNSITSGQGFLLNYGYLHDSLLQGNGGQISSPLYPYQYHGAGDFDWRIFTSNTETISIAIDRYLIPAYNEMSYNKLTIYDGYDTTAPVLGEFQGAFHKALKKEVLQTSSNVAYITLTMDESNTGSLFHLTWAKFTASEELTQNPAVNCGSNETEMVMPGRSTFFKSPNYPHSYENNLLCEWVFGAQPGRHLYISFVDFQLEETSACFADSVSIYSSNALANWKPINESICEVALATAPVSVASTYMKIKLNTDSSVTKKGFLARVASKCGGTLTDLSSEITISYLDVFEAVYVPKLRCNWTVKVRPGRTIKIEFTHFNITNDVNKCITSLTIRNGDSSEAPLLGSGRYCGYSHENREGIVTSSNALFISYFTSTSEFSHVFQNFIIRYEEKNEECGLTTRLTADHTWEVIYSPNYPSIPIPYTECEWTIIGPPGEILRIDFIDRFDLISKGDDCPWEYVEIRDGSSKLSPLKKRICREKPGTIKTTNNAMYVKYLTQVDEPNNGFKANISIDYCGGTIIASAGELTSPGYPHMPVLSPSTVCTWIIIGPPRHVFRIVPNDIKLPESDNPDDTRVTIEETIPSNSTTIILKSLRDGLSNLQPIESSTNQISVKLHVGVPSRWTHIASAQGFRLTFNSSRPICGGVITSPDGYLTTPSYPQDTTVRYCQWTIKVPNKGRRVRLELVDYNTEKHKIGIFNDIQFSSILQIVPNDDLSPETKVFETAGYQLALYVWLNRLVTSHRFKARFSSDEPALCGGELSDPTGDIISPNIQQSYSCGWYFNSQNLPSSDSSSLSQQTTYLTVSINSSITRILNHCRYTDSKLIIRSPAETSYKMPQLYRDVCGTTDETYRLPTIGFSVKAIKHSKQDLTFSFHWTQYPCGGIVKLTEAPINILNIPSSYNDSIECAWILVVPVKNKIEITTEGSFKMDCDDQYVKINQGLGGKAPTIKHICKTKALGTPIAVHFSHLFVQYHSKSYNNTDVKLIAKIVNNQCGGFLFSYQNVFTSPNYPKGYSPNQECVWEIQAELGYRVSLSFIERFSIETNSNCTKDAVIIYDWKNDDFTEIARVCGREPPPVYNSTHNRMKVVFRTDATTNGDGFKAQWKPICGGKYIATEKEQILYSPGYPYTYPRSSSCDYEITASYNKVFLKFLEFEMEGPYPECNNDNLTIVAESDYNYYYEMYCGKEMPAILSSYDKISLSFKTDSYLQRRGFKVSYSVFKCGGKVNDSTVLSSSWGETYGENLNCTWSIEAPTSKRVVLKFLYIDLESHSDCYSDFIAVYEGPSTENDKRLALMCGHVNSTTILRSKSNTLTLEFITDSSINFKGFKVQVFFSYSESAGCGGQIDLAASSSLVLKSPLISNNVVYDNFLDCQWLITAPRDNVIKISFTAFHISPCQGVNQTALGQSKCDCDLVEIKDGANPNSLIIGQYCGHTLPPQLISSGNLMSIRIYTDGDLVSSGFEANLSVERAVCGNSLTTLSQTIQKLKSPGFNTGVVPRGLHCIYHLDASAEPYAAIRLYIKTLDLIAPETSGGNANRCTKDKLVISSNPVSVNSSLGKDYVMNHQSDNFFSGAYSYDRFLEIPTQIELCGRKPSTEYYIYGNTKINLITSSESDSEVHKGIEIEVSYVGFCGRNYSEPYGRIQAAFTEISSTIVDCYTLIVAPENYTISAYFITSVPDYWDENCYLDMFDGNSTTSPLLVKIKTDYDNYPVFSTGRYLLMHNHQNNLNRVTFDLNYVVTDKGRGCGGKLVNEVGKVTSPMYPNIYRKQSRCEWELETPVGTHLLLHFNDFELGVSCDQNYLQIVDRKGDVYSTHCSNTIPADYTSNDNYVKVVFVTSMNNGGKGWVADFIGLI